MNQLKIVVETLLPGKGSQIELSVELSDKISMIKWNIQKTLGIPTSQQHLLLNNTELNDCVFLKDIPVYQGMRLRLVLGMKIGLPSFTTEYDNWLDINDVMQKARPLTIKTKYLVYKGCKKNVHRLWKLNGEKSGKSRADIFGSNAGEDDKFKKITDQIRTTEKMSHLRQKMAIANTRKKLKSIQFSTAEAVPKSREAMSNHLNLVAPHQTRQKISPESEMQTEGSLLRSRLSKTILCSTTSVPSLINKVRDTRHDNDNAATNKLSRSGYVFNCTESPENSSLTANSTTINHEYLNHLCETASATKGYDNSNTTTVRDILLQNEFINVKDPEIPNTSNDIFKNIDSNEEQVPEINEYYVPPKLLVRREASSASPPPILEKLIKTENGIKSFVENSKSSESFMDFYENLNSSKSKLNDYSNCFQSLVSPSNRFFYHSDLDLNQLDDRFRRKLSLNSHDEDNQNLHSEWSRKLSSLLPLIDIQNDLENATEGEINYDRFSCDSLSNNLATTSNKDNNNNNEEVGENEKEYGSIDIFGDDLTSSSSNIKELTSQPGLMENADKFKKKFGLLGHRPSTSSSTKLTATSSTSTIVIPQLPRLDTKHRRGYINLNDACSVSISDLNTSKMVSPTIALDQKSFSHGASIFHCNTNQDQRHRQQQKKHREINISELNDRISAIDSQLPSKFNGRRICNSYHSNINKLTNSFSSHLKRTNPSSDSQTPPIECDPVANQFDYQSNENLFNMNFDSFYEDFIDSPELSWSSSSSGSSISSFGTLSTSSNSLLDKLPDLPDIASNEFAATDEIDKSLNKNQHFEGQSRKVPSRCFHCNKKLGIVMIFKCHCQQYFCAAHRYMEIHECNYNYKLEGRKKLELENPLCASEKLPKI